MNKHVDYGLTFVNEEFAGEVKTYFPFISKQIE